MKAESQIECELQYSIHNILEQLRFRPDPIRLPLQLSTVIIPKQINSCNEESEWP